MVQVYMVQKVKVIIGAGSVYNLSDILVGMKRENPLIVCDQGIVGSGIFDVVADILKASRLDYAAFSEVLADPPDELAAKGYETYLRNHCDCVVGLGGGSAIDTAKAINILCYNEGPILRYAKGGNMKPSPGLIVIPTTSGTGSEMSDGLVITSGKTKFPILADQAMSEYAILDPELTKSMPPMLTAVTGFDALAHVVEAYTSTAANALTDMICEKVMMTIKEWLPKAVKDGTNLEAREKMMIASCMGGFMLTQAHSNAGHSLAHIVGGYFKIPHGYCCAYALPYIVEFNAKALPDKTRWIASCFDKEVAEDASYAVIGFAAKDGLISFRDKTLGMRKSSEWDIDSERFDEMARDIITEPFQTFNPVKMEEEDAVKLLKAILSE